MGVYQFQNGDNGAIKKEKIVGIVFLVLSCLAFLFLFTNILPFMKAFFLGVFGLFAYPLFLSLFVLSIALISNKKIILSPKYITFLSLSICFVLAIIQLAVLGKPEVSFFEYLGLSYTKQLTAGGILISLITAPVLYIFDLFVAYIVFSLALIVCIALTADYLHYIKRNENAKLAVPIKTKVSIKKEKPKTEDKIENEENVKTEQPKQEKQEKEQVKIVLDAELEKEEKENPAKVRLGVIAGNLKPSSQFKGERKYPEDVYKYIMTPPKIDLSQYSIQREKKEEAIKERFDEIKKEPSFNAFSNATFNSSNPIKLQTEKVANDIMPSKIVHDEMPSFAVDKKISKSKPFLQPLESIIEEEEDTQSEDYADEILKRILDETKPIDITSEPIAPKITRRTFSQLEIEGTKPMEPVKPSKKFYTAPPSYTRPPIDLLKTDSVDLSSLNEDVVGKRMQLESALDMFKIPAKVIGVVVGPTVTRYELEMPPGISVKKIIAHSDDIALALASNGGIRIEAPIPGKSAVGVEVPNDKVATVSIKEILSSPDFINSKSPLTFALGKDISGLVRVCNLEKMPHLLVAGATNSGKSVCLNSIIVSLIYKTSPEDVRLILIDPKRVEFSFYNQIPHLLIPNVITEADKAINAFSWAINEMERRFAIFMECRVRNIAEYNQLEDVKLRKREKIPYIVIIVDELADLMAIAKKDAEEKIMRLAQKARACGIHLILATQRPSVDVITGTIKANFPSRIAFKVTSYQDSRTILDQGGAEKLVGKGDMLYSPSDAAEPRRLQGCFVTNEEIERIVNFVRDNNDLEFDEEIQNAILNPKSVSTSQEVQNENESGFDPLMPEALKIVIENGQASISLLQRRLEIGYPRAARIIDQMEGANFISPSDGSKPRQVYITPEQYEELFGNNN